MNSMVVMQCNGFVAIRQGDSLIIESGLQSFILKGINGNVNHLKALTENIKPTSTMTELVGLFYTRDIDGYAREQLVEMYPIRRESYANAVYKREEQPQ